MAAGMAGSAILKVVSDVATRKAQGHAVSDLTMGDFDPRQFPIPAELAGGIEVALRNGQTSYPPGAGMPALREAIRAYSREGMGLDYPSESVLVTSGARPGIYATYRTLVDAGDRVVYCVPSWQNSYYCQLVGATPDIVTCDASTQFLPTRAMLEPVVRGARLLALNSPLNPTGTMFDAATLGDICDLVLEENARRGGRERPLYVLYDQVYWALTFGDTPHVTPVALRPEMAPYTISIDAISKAFAATGLRVGWVLGPADIVRSMGDFLSHVGTWAPRPEQVATAALLMSRETMHEYHRELRLGLKARLDAMYGGITAMREAGLPVDAMAPAGAIYLSAQFALPFTEEATRAYLLEEADFAVIPFQGFGVTEDSWWFRLSAGAVSVADIERALPKVASAVARATTANSPLAARPVGSRAG